MSSSNPAFNDKAIKGLESISHQSGIAAQGAPATIQGTVNKTMLLLLMMVGVSAASWNFAEALMASGVLIPMFIATFIGQLVMTFMMVRNPARSKSLAIIYALTEGVVLGAISYMFERLYPNIVFHAILGTSGVILGMLFIYKLRIIKVTENFKIMVGAATMGVAFLYIVNMIMSMFGVNMPYIHENTPFGIGFSLLVIGIASFNLAVDFDFIEKCEEQKAPSYMEWYGAFGLMLTIVWIYIEILRLLAKSRK